MAACVGAEPHASMGCDGAGGAETAGRAIERRSETGVDPVPADTL